MEEKTIAVSIAYKDRFGEHRLAYEQDLNAWSNMIKLGDTPPVEIAGHLKKISSTLSRWDKSGRLNVATFNKSDMQREREEQEEEMNQWLSEQSEEKDRPSGS